MHTEWSAGYVTLPVAIVVTDDVTDQSTESTRVESVDGRPTLMVRKLHGPNAQSARKALPDTSSYRIA